MTERQAPYTTSRTVSGKSNVEIPSDLLAEIRDRQRKRARLLNAAINALPTLREHAPALADQLAAAIEGYKPGTLKDRHVDDAPALDRKSNGGPA